MRTKELKNDPTNASRKSDRPLCLFRLKRRHHGPAPSEAPSIYQRLFFLFLLFAAESPTTRAVLKKPDDILIVRCPKLSLQYNPSSFPTFPNLLLRREDDSRAEFKLFVVVFAREEYLSCPSARGKAECEAIAGRVAWKEEEGFVSFSLRVSFSDGDSTLVCEDLSSVGFTPPPGVVQPSVYLTTVDPRMLEVDVAADALVDGVRAGTPLNATCRAGFRGDDAVPLEAWVGAKRADAPRRPDGSVGLRNYFVSADDHGKKVRCVLRPNDEEFEEFSQRIKVLYAPTGVEAKVVSGDGRRWVECTSGPSNPFSISWSATPTDSSVSLRDPSAVVLVVDVVTDAGVTVECFARNSIGSTSDSIFVPSLSDFGPSIQVTGETPGPGVIAGIVVALILVLVALLIVVAWQRRRLQRWRNNYLESSKCRLECCCCSFESIVKGRKRRAAEAERRRQGQNGAGTMGRPPPPELPPPFQTGAAPTEIPAFFDHQFFGYESSPPEMTEITMFSDSGGGSGSGSGGIFEKMSFDNPMYDGEFEAANVAENEYEMEDGQGCFLDRRSMRRLGVGNFGTVYEAVLVAPGVRQSVAVKTMKSGSAEEEDKFKREASCMRHLAHDNVVRLVGVSTRGPLHIVTEFMELGDLKTHLMGKGQGAGAAELFGYSLQICRGMTYLASKLIVHRDLAARNVLLNADGVAKIADFGMTRVLDDAEHYYMAPADSKAPIRWTAPEALKEKKFTSQSDVWSYGVTLTEIYTKGLTPYPGRQNYDVYQLVVGGGRMTRPPEILDDQVWTLATRCFEVDPLERSTFAAILEELEETLGDDDDDDDDDHEDDEGVIHYLDDEELRDNPEPLVKGGGGDDDDEGVENDKNVAGDDAEDDVDEDVGEEVDEEVGEDAEDSKSRGADSETKTEEVLLED